jgi:hypothetical protein
MSWSERDESEADGEFENRSDTLFAGDTGELPFQIRRVFVQLLSGPSLDGRRHSKLWPVFLHAERILRSRFSELFLELVVDYDQQVAFTRQANTGDLEAPVLLRRSPLTFIDSVLLLFLRQRLTQADAHGERAAVDLDEIIESVSLYQQTASTDHAGFSKKVQASIEKLKSNSILQKIRGNESRFEVSPVLKLLFSAEEVQALAHEYRTLADEAALKLATEPDVGMDQA